MESLLTPTHHISLALTPGRENTSPPIWGDLLFSLYSTLLFRRQKCLLVHWERCIRVTFLLKEKPLLGIHLDMLSFLGSLSRLSFAQGSYLATWRISPVGCKRIPSLENQCVQEYRAEESSKFFLKHVGRIQLWVRQWLNTERKFRAGHELKKGKKRIISRTVSGCHTLVQLLKFDVKLLGPSALLCYGLNICYWSLAPSVMVFVKGDFRR